MSLNKGKQERKYHKFLGEEYRIDSIPCGISIPFNVELNKLRIKALEIVFEIDPKTPRNKIFVVLEDYLKDHPDEAQEQMDQMIRTLSVITEFFTNGKIDEKYISMEADPEEINDFLDAIQQAQQEKALKKLQKIREISQ